MYLIIKNDTFLNWNPYNIEMSCFSFPIYRIQWLWFAFLTKQKVNIDLLCF